MSGLAAIHFHVPSLREILPSGGLPGLVYAFIATKNLIQAQEEGYDMVRKPGFIIENQDTGNREGALLMAKGKINTGLSPSAGARRVMVDPSLTELFEITVGEPTPEPIVQGGVSDADANISRVTL